MANPDIAKFITKDRLREIRDHTDWRELFRYLGLERDRKSTEKDWWAVSPLNPDEKHASFHINDRGWTCFSTHESGYVIELVQHVIGRRTGRAMNCYEAGRWLLENGLSHVGLRASGDFTSSIPSPSGSGAGGKGVGIEKGDGKVPEDMGKDREIKGGRIPNRENLPIRQTLIPSLDMEYPEFKRRGISPETCAYLGCGYLPEPSKSPLAGRVVFQVRGLQEEEAGTMQTVILTHMGRATTEQQEEQEGKWKPYAGFRKTLELYNIDRVILDEEAVRQARETGHVIVTEGSFDVAKLVEAGIRNTVATFGAHLAEAQIQRLELIADRTGVQEFLFWYDRDQAGKEGQKKALEVLKDAGKITAKAFEWDMAFPSPARGKVKIPEEIGDVCEFSVEQLRWLRDKEVI
jgi:5S rRNA maturation endonuclease (ribonuclease M5)